MSTKSYKGLNREQVKESRRRYGANVLTPPQRVSLWRMYLDKFADPIIRILLLALLASFVISLVEFVGSQDADYMVFFEPVGILIAIFLATYIGFIFEVKAAREFDILSESDEMRPIQIIRERIITTIPACEVVVGDIVMLHEGDKIPADGTLLECISLQVSEAALTGEQLTSKSVTERAAHDSAYEANRVFRDTIVMSGHGIYKVTAVGDNTESGRLLGDTMHEASAKTPLTLQLEKLGGLITYGSYIIAAIVVLGRMVAYWMSLGDAPLAFDFAFLAYTAKSIMLALTLIVVAVPEGLPMSVTLSLALSMRRMLKTGNLVRKMHACETMGACTVICTDKTGTLTENRMTLHQLYTRPIPEALELTYENMAVNATAHLRFENDDVTVLGNPTEGALLLYLQQKGCDYVAMRTGATILSQLPFTTERKLMATLVQSHVSQQATPLLYVKGAPEIILQYATGLTAEEHQTIKVQLEVWQHAALRTLAFAYKPWDKRTSISEATNATQGNVPQSESSTIHEEELQGLTLLSLVAIKDPVRADVPQAVNDCKAAGIKLKIVTGDNINTAREVGREIGLTADSSTRNMEITGEEIAALTDEALTSIAPDIAIVSRARPTDKRRLVEALTRCGEIVAVTGDGTNDAPALKAAHVGLSMGDGTSVAKEASEITILDNSFSSIVRAVKWGRSLYRNIRRFLLFQLTINVAACLVMMGGAFWGTQSPLSVTQMLWVNLIMDTFAALALASLPPEDDVMTLKPRRAGEAIVSRAMWTRILSVGLLFTAMLMGLLYVFHHYEVTPTSGLVSLRWPVETNMHDPLSLYEETLFFTYFVMLQFWNLFNVRVYGTLNSALHRIGACRGLLLVCAVILVGQFLLVEFGGSLVGTQHLDWDDWLTAFCSTSVVLLFGEGIRWVYRLHAKQPHSPSTPEVAERV